MRGQPHDFGTYFPPGNCHDGAVSRRRFRKTAEAGEASQQTSLASEATVQRAIELYANDDDAGLRDLFDKRMKVAVSLENLADTRQRAHDAQGSLVSIGEPLTGSSRGAEIYDFPLTYERGGGHLQIAVMENKIAGLLVRPGRPTGTWGRSRGLLREVVRDFVRSGWFRVGRHRRGNGHT